MKIALINLKPQYLLAILLLLSFSSLGHAEKIYTWKDSDGKRHYTNNPALVPSEPKASKIINMKNAPLPPEEETEVKISGADIWAKQCSSCHILSAYGKEGFRGIRGLVDNINNPSTTPAAEVIVLKAALDDQMDDAARIELTEAEIKAVTTYIRQEILMQNANETGVKEMPEGNSVQKPGKSI